MLRKYRASCHCGRVAVEAELDLSQPSYRCNCSICRRNRFWAAVAKPEGYRLLSGEALVVAALGAAGGAALGIAYAAMMVHGLNTWWVDATAAPFLELHVTARSIAIGVVAGLAVAMLTVRWSLRGLARLTARQLLAGDSQSPHIDSSTCHVGPERGTGASWTNVARRASARG